MPRSLKQLRIISCTNQNSRFTSRCLNGSLLGRTEVLQNPSPRELRPRVVVLSSDSPPTSVPGVVVRYESMPVGLEHAQVWFPGPRGSGKRVCDERFKRQACPSLRNSCFCAAVPYSPNDLRGNLIAEPFLAGGTLDFIVNSRAAPSISRCF